MSTARFSRTGLGLVGASVVGLALVAVLLVPGAAVGGVDGDGNVDVVFANASRERNRVCLGDGSGGFTCGDVSINSNTSDGLSPAGAWTKCCVAPKPILGPVRMRF